MSVFSRFMTGLASLLLLAALPAQAQSNDIQACKWTVRAMPCQVGSTQQNSTCRGEMIKAQEAASASQCWRILDAQYPKISDSPLARCMMNSAKLYADSGGNRNTNSNTYKSLMFAAKDSNYDAGTCQANYTNAANAWAKEKVATGATAAATATRLQPYVCDPAKLTPEGLKGCNAANEKIAQCNKESNPKACFDRPTPQQQAQAPQTPQTGTQQTAAQKPPAQPPVQSTQPAAAPAANATACLSDQYKGRTNFQCSAVVGGWDNGQKSFGVSQAICSRADAEALAKANDVGNCNNLIFNIEKRMQDAAAGVAKPVIASADAAVNSLKAKFAAAADTNGATNKAFWTTWKRIYDNCSNVPKGTPPSADRLMSYCGFNAQAKQDPTLGLVGLTAVVNACTAATCTLDSSKVKFPSN